MRPLWVLEGSYFAYHWKINVIWLWDFLSFSKMYFLSKRVLSSSTKELSCAQVDVKLQYEIYMYFFLFLGIKTCLWRRFISFLLDYSMTTHTHTSHRITSHHINHKHTPFLLTVGSVMKGLWPIAVLWLKPFGSQRPAGPQHAVEKARGQTAAAWQCFHWVRRLKMIGLGQAGLGWASSLACLLYACVFVCWVHAENMKRKCAASPHLRFGSGRTMPSSILI